MTAEEIAEDLIAEFVIQHRAGGHDADRAYIASFIRRTLARGPIGYAYYNNGGKTLRLTSDKKYAEQNADGFNWSNPRIRHVALVEIAIH